MTRIGAAASPVGAMMTAKTPSWHATVLLAKTVARARPPASAWHTRARVRLARAASRAKTRQTNVQATRVVTVERASMRYYNTILLY